MSTHTFPIQIRFNDIDTLGHVNNVMYSHYFDMARYDFLKQVFGGMMDLHHGRYILIMVRIENDFIRPSFMEDRLQVETEWEEIGNRSIRLRQRVVDHEGQVRVNSLCVMSTYDKLSGKSFEITDEWRSRMPSLRK